MSQITPTRTHSEENTTARTCQGTRASARAAAVAAGDGEGATTVPTGAPVRMKRCYGWRRRRCKSVDEAGPSVDLSRMAAVREGACMLAGGFTETGAQCWIRIEPRQGFRYHLCIRFGR